MPESFLVLALLTTESSVQAQTSRPATTAAVDTAQFWLSPNRRWRIRTHALDHDIHVYELLSRPDRPDFNAAEAVKHLRRHYADRLGRLCVLRFQDAADPAERARVATAQGLTGSVEQVALGFVFYNPDAGPYRTQSESLTLPQSLL